MPSTPAISTPMKLPSSCEWTASYRSASARRRAVTVRVRSSGIFAQRRADPDLVHEGRAQTAEHPQTRQRHVAAERIRDEIDGMAELEQRTDAVVLAERRAPGLEERLRRDHQDFHDLVPGIVGNAPGKVNVTLAVCMG